MGTSISLRSPNVPRWRVFQQALAAQMQGQLPLERLRAEFFSAAQVEWQEALSAPAVAVFASAITDAWGGMPERLQRGGSAERLIASEVDSARNAAQAAGFTPALAIAERAYHLTLVRAARAEGAL